MIFILWIIVWLLLNYFFWWFNFNTILCFLVGIFIIMPILLKIKVKDLFKEIIKHKKLILVDILLNFIVSLLIAFLVSYFIFWLEYYPYVFTLILLSIIPGGWLLMNWLHQTKANLHIWFSLFTLNLVLFSFVFMIYNVWTDFFINKYSENFQVKTWNTNNFSYSTWFWQQNNFLSNSLNNQIKTWKEQFGCAINDFASKTKLKFSWCDLQDNSTLIYGFYWFVVLILIPFIFSRLMLLFIKEKYKQNIFKYVNLFNKISVFVLIVYIFSLSYVRKLFDIDILIVEKSIIAIILFYVLLFVINQLIIKFFKLKEDIDKSLFWNSFSKFITLTLVFSVLYAISWKTPWIIIIPILAYFVQIILSILISMYYNKWKY